LKGPFGKTAPWRILQRKSIINHKVKDFANTQANLATRFYRSDYVTVGNRWRGQQKDINKK
jgi:hypothetical protein